MLGEYVREALTYFCNGYNSSCLLRFYLVGVRLRKATIRGLGRSCGFADNLCKDFAAAPSLTNPGTTPITILSVNLDHGLSFAREETRTMVWASFSLQIFTVCLNSGDSNSEFWSEFQHFMWMGVVPAPSTSLKPPLLSGFRKRGRRNGVASDFLPFLPFSSVFFRFFRFIFRKTGRHRSRDPFCETPILSHWFPGIFVDSPRSRSSWRWDVDSFQSFCWVSLKPQHRGPRHLEMIVSSALCCLHSAWPKLGQLSHPPPQKHYVHRNILVELIFGSLLWSSKMITY